MSEQRPTVYDLEYNPETGQWDFVFNRDENLAEVQNEIDFPVKNQSDFPVEKPVQTKNRSRFSGTKAAVKDWLVYLLIAVVVMLFAVILGTTLENTYHAFGVVGLAVQAALGASLAMYINRSFNK